MPSRSDREGVDQEGGHDPQHDRELQILQDLVLELMSFKNIVKEWEGNQEGQ